MSKTITIPKTDPVSSDLMRDLKPGVTGAQIVRALAQFSPGTVDKEKRTVQLVWSTGATVRRRNWMGDVWDESLSMDPSSVNLERLNNGAALLNSHQQWSLDSQIGVVERAWIENGKGLAEVRFSSREDVAPIFQDIIDGIIRNVSVGYSVEKWDITEEDGKPANYTASLWTPHELSFVCVPADSGAGVRSDELNPCEIPNTSAVSAEVEMEKEIKSPALDAGVEIRKAQETERARCIEIRSLAKKAKLDESFADECIEKGIEISEVRALAIDAIAAKSEKQEIKGHTDVQVGEDLSRKALMEGVENALAVRAQVPGAVVTETGRNYMGMSVLRMAEEFLGSKARGLSKHALAKRAMSTSDFPYLLANVAGKSLRAAYEVAPKTFSPFIKTGTLPDFKVMSRVQFGEASSLAEVKEGAEVTQGSIGEGKESIQLVKYGKRFAFTDIMMINDDLSALQRLPALYANAAARKESDLVYTTTLVGNPTMGDSVALFHASHGNLPTGAAIDSASLTAAAILLMNQKGLDSLDFLGLSPKFLVCGPAKMVEAKQAVSAQVIPNAISGVNVWAGSMQVIVDPRITGNKWFMIDNTIDTIELAFLEGAAGPQMTQQICFDTSSLEMKVEHMVGVKAIDYRGMVYNAGN